MDDMLPLQGVGAFPTILTLSLAEWCEIDVLTYLTLVVCPLKGNNSMKDEMMVLCYFNAPHYFW